MIIQKMDAREMLTEWFHGAGAKLPLRPSPLPCLPVKAGCCAGLSDPCPREKHWRPGRDGLPSAASGGVSGNFWGSPPCRIDRRANFQSNGAQFARKVHAKPEQCSLKIGLHLSPIGRAYLPTPPVLQDRQHNQHDGEDGNCGPGKQALF